MTLQLQPRRIMLPAMRASIIIVHGLAMEANTLLQSVCTQVPNE